MMTRRLTVLFDDTETDTGQTAHDTINQLRDLSRQLADERRRHSDHTPAYRELALQWQETTDDLAISMLDAALVWSDGDAAQACEDGSGSTRGGE